MAFNREYLRLILNQSADGFQFRKILLLSGGHFSNDVFSSFLAVFLPLLIDKFSLTMAACRDIYSDLSGAQSDESPVGSFL